MALQPVTTDRVDVKRLWEAVESETRALRADSLGGTSTLVAAQPFAAAGSQVLNHKLDKTPTEWWVVDQSADVRVWRSAWNAKTITIHVSAACSALSIRVR
jgi:hypothetical protein